MRAAVVNRLLKKRALATTGGSSATSFQKYIIWVGVKPQEMASVDLQRIKARDGLEVPVWITRPANTTGPLPAVVLVRAGDLLA